MSELTLQAARRIDPKRITLALAASCGLLALAGIAVELGLDSWAFEAFDLSNSNLDRQLSMPATFTALMLGLSGVLAFALVGVDRSRRRRTWALAGIAFLLFAVEKLLGLHSWLGGHGVDWTFSYLPLIALGGAALYRTIHVFRSQRTVQLLFATAVVLWLAAGLLDDPDLVASSAAAQIVGMAAAALFTACLLERLRYLARQYYPLEENDTRLSVDQIVAEAADLVKLQPIAIVLVLLTSAFALQEVLLQTGNYHGHRIPILDLDGEQTFFATFQSALIATAGLLALGTGFLKATPAGLRRSWKVFGGALLVVATEEFMALPNRFEDATGASGQILLIPVAVVGVVALWKVLRATGGDRRARFLFLAGALLWLGSQAIDVFFQDDARWTAVPEETAETLGSICLIFACASWLRRLLAVGLMPLDPIAGPLNGPAVIEQLPARDARVQAPTG
jgi:hypothetical protein